MRQSGKSESAAWLLLFLLAAAGLAGLPCPAASGTITFGGDLIDKSVATPALLAGSDRLDMPFAASVPNLGIVSGSVQLRNDGATAGAIRLLDLQFQSLRPVGSGAVSFSVAVDQDFAYTGPPTVKGVFALRGSTTFTAAPQSSNGFVAGFLGVVLDPLPFGFSADPQSAFPQMHELGTAGDLQGLTAKEIMSLRLLLSLRLSDNAVAPGPRFDVAGGGAFASIGYAAPIPEPPAWILLGLGALSLFGYIRRRDAMRVRLPWCQPGSYTPYASAVRRADPGWSEFYGPGGEES